ncbi:MAG TPA: UDP-N-acetylmuramate--L-alanine ligase [Solirubrobacteraceae bacterium]|nr:UDP-N-acetylmuramate--L-alanine ligase [Solirubrobacteraceae bacterium]
MSASWSGRRLHFVGVGGAGMSGYARAAHALGAQISGSDRADSPYLERLRADGVLDASIGHDSANLPAGDDVEVVYSSAVPPESPERVAARERGLPERPRAELLGELSALRRTVAVAGTHGKTTTASMLVHILRAAGMEPGWLVGAPVGGGLPNAHWGAGEWLVVEADESDRSMLALAVEVAVLTNVELDHHASFASLAELRAAFRAFLALARSAVVVWDRAELVELARGEGVSGEGGVEVSGESEEGVSVRSGDGVPGKGVETNRGARVLTYDVPTPTLIAGGSRFAWHEHEVRLAVPGAHNALNAAAALEAASLAGADAERAIAGLAGFTGAGRRFQRVGAVGGAVVYEDYAHHPTELAATLRAARTLEPRRLVAVFQPHLYSRTALLAREFGEALALADVAVVLDVYPARERAADFPGVSGLTIALAAADAAGGRPVMWLPTFADALPVLRGLLADGDLCLVMGAGDIDALGRHLGAAGDVEASGGRLVGGAGDVEATGGRLSEGGAGS